MKPIIGITMGDPAGIGPEVVIKTLSCPWVINKCRPLVLGDEGIMVRALKKSPFRKKIQKIADPDDCKSSLDTIYLLELSKLKAGSVSYGKPSKASAVAMVEYVKKAVTYALGGEIDAIVTAPINKEAMQKAGFSYPGHTELLAKMTAADDHAMMLCGKRLKVVLVTTHCSINQVPRRIKKDKIVRTIKVVYRDFRKYFNKPNPKIAIAALNPHSGEEGIFGREEKLEIRPAVLAARKRGIDVIGPISPDTLFYFALKNKYDVVICMYHDQGLIPLKMLHFENAVNVTLGLPIIRTSVDHGTAYDIAGKGIANPSSMIEAVKLASKMARIKNRH